MAPKPPKPKPKQDNRVLTPARRSVLYDQWLGGRSLEELSAKWRKPIHRINEALVMERAERNLAKALRDRDTRKENHEVAIEPPLPRTVTATIIEGMDFRPCTCHPDDRPEPCQHKYALGDCLRALTPIDAVPEPPEAPSIGPEVPSSPQDAAPPRPVADLIEDAIRRKLG